MSCAAIIIVRSLNDLGLACFKPLGAFYVFPKITAHRIDQPRVFAAACSRRSGSPACRGLLSGRAAKGSCVAATRPVWIRSKWPLNGSASFSRRRRSDGARKAVLLAAGRGTRMRELTNELPKPMIEVRGKPILFTHR